jgi:hypothetical protein
MGRHKRRPGPLAQYAENGPSPVDLIPYADRPALADRMVSEWRAWRAEHLSEWRAGGAAPPPPHADRFLGGGR